MSHKKIIPAPVAPSFKVDPSVAICITGLIVVSNSLSIILLKSVYVFFCWIIDRSPDLPYLLSPGLNKILYSMRSHGGDSHVGRSGGLNNVDHVCL